MTTVSINKEGYEAVAKLAGKMQICLKRKVSLGTATGYACRYVLSETKRVEEALSEEVR